VEFIAEYSEWQAIGVPSNAPFYLDAPRSINGRMYTHQTMYLSVLSFPQNCKKGTQRNRYLHFLIKVGSQQQCSPKFSTCLIPMNSSANSSRPSKYRTGHYVGSTNRKFLVSCCSSVTFGLGRRIQLSCMMVLQRPAKKAWRTPVEMKKTTLTPRRELWHLQVTSCHR
jgi:hypothetical protein